jgi:PKD repeat protein
MLVIGLVLTAGQVTAERATSLEMAQAAQNFVAEQIAENGAWAGTSDADLTRVQEITIDGEILGRCYSFNPGGYVVVPVLKEMGPIKLYSEHGDLDVEAQDGMADLIRTALATHAEEYIKVYGSLDTPQSTGGDKMHFNPVDRAEFDRLAVNPKLFSDRVLKGASDAKDTVVGPLLDVHWHQSEPYNTYCPPGTPVGCVATAFAQIMQYWNWPTEGAGSSGYWWDGDGGPSEYLTADYWDSYDWANMPDYCPYPACSTVAQDSAVAELNYEVAVAFEMDFGADGSGVTWSEIVNTGMPAMVDNFLYKSTWDAEYRNGGHTSQTWFEMIQAEIDAERPIPYTIWGHAIVCDGWKIDNDSLNYYHMNYGWNDGNNAWYRVDDLYYPDGENQYLYDKVVRFFEPDQSVMFTTEDRLGWVPFDAHFEGASEMSVDSYNWQFGDGGTGEGDTCTHTYTEAGVYDVSLEVMSGGTPYNRTKNSYVLALADTLYSDTLLVDPSSDWTDIQVYARNTIPLRKMTIPIEFNGDVEIDPYTMTWSTDGLRSSVFDQVERTHFDPMNRRMTIVMENTGAGSDLTPGSGPILELSFEFSNPPATGDSTQIALDGYPGRTPTFEGSLASYDALAMNGLLHLSSCCQGIRGNIDGDPLEEINIADLVYLVSYMFQNGPEPTCMKEANVDGDIFEQIDIADLVYLTSYMFQGGPEPAICF